MAARVDRRDASPIGSRAGSDTVDIRMVAGLVSRQMALLRAQRDTLYDLLLVAEKRLAVHDPSAAALLGRQAAVASTRFPTLGSGAETDADAGSSRPI